MQKIVISSHSRYPVDRKELRKSVQKALLKYGLKSDYKVHIVVVGDRQMVYLNQRYMKRTGTADVLSFPLIDFNGTREENMAFWPKEQEEKLLDLGEIVICYPQAKRQAIRENKTMDRQVCWLAEHGIEHLMGHHHD